MTASPRDPLRVLFVTPYVPSPLRPRPFNLIRQLTRREHRVVLFCIATSRDDERAAERLRDRCERVEVVRVTPGRALGNCLAGLLTAYPLQACYCQSGRMRRLIRGAVAPEGTPTFAADVVHVEHLRAARFGLGLSGVARVYDSVDCISLLFDEAARAGAPGGARLRAWLDRARTRRFEARLLGRFPRILVAAARDRQALAALRAAPAPGPSAEVTVVPNGVDVDHFEADDRPRDAATLLFLGRLGYHANVRAATHLVDDIMPRVWAVRPDARVVLAGADPAPAVKALGRRHPSRVEVTGYVPDVRPWLARATLSVNPLPYAVGVQNKVLEALAMRAPVVATSHACGGLRVEDDRELLVADDAVTFARRIAELLADPDRRRRLADRGRTYVEAHHDWRESGQRLEEVYREELARRAADRPDPRVGSASA